MLGISDGSLRINKTSSTPHDPGAAVVTGLVELLRASGISPAAVAEVVHGTTVASNTILEKKGARVGLLTTRGFRDVLEIGRVRMPDLFDLTWEMPLALVERRLRLEVDMDYSAALCDGTGRMIAQARTIAQHLGAVPDAMESVLREFDGDLWPGDVVAMNDPYLGGMHIPDVFLFMPIFADGRIEAFAVVIGHQTDMGGRVPGSNASDSTEIYQEGLRLPPIKLYERGVPSRSVWRIIEKNVRVPDRVLGDIGAQYAACKVGEREFLKLHARHGAETLHSYTNELLDYAERLTRAEIARWPQGRFTFTDHLDSDGLSDDPVPLTVAITVHADGHLTCDWTGQLAPGARGAQLDLVLHEVVQYLSVRSVLRQDAPNNAGVFRCIDVIAPAGTILNPYLPGACAARALTGYRMLDVMLGALAQVLPDRVPAAGEGGNTVLLSHSHGDKPFVRDLAGRLTQAGATVWLDEAELGVGDSLIERISAAIEETDWMVAILSPRSVQSTWVQKELNLAMTKEVRGRRVTVLPVLTEACDVPHFLRDKLYADFTRPEDHEREFAKLLTTIGLAPAPAYTNVAPTAASRGAEDVVYLVRRSLADQVADRDRERKAEKFALVQADHGLREYSLQEIDRLTETQRTKLFAADPEMEAWWRGRSPTNGAWPHFRVKGGIWLAKEQIDGTPREDHRALWEGIPDLLDWYLRDRLF